MLTDPVNTITILTDLLGAFAQYSGYEINESMSLLLGVNIPLESRAIITFVMAAPWSSCNKYLGIRLTDTMQPATLLNLNLSPIVRSIRAQ